MSDDWILSLDQFGVAFGEQVVLASIDLHVPRVGVVSLVGNAGAGKSTLLRTLSGLNDAQPELQTWGTATYCGRPLGEGDRPAMVLQKAKLLTATVRENLVSALPNRAEMRQPEQTTKITDELVHLGLGTLSSKLSDMVVSLPLIEQRALSLVRATLTGAPLVLVDEPTAQLQEPESARLAEILYLMSQEHALVLVTHDQRLPQRLGGRVALLAGGRIHEHRNSNSFFEFPETEPAKSFVATGRTRVPSPMAKKEDLSPSSPPPPPLPAAARVAVSRLVGPRGFHWILPGALGGLPRPGIVRDLQQDLDGLKRLGVTQLVTLEETETVPFGKLDEDLHGTHFPVVDMSAPTLEATAEFCAKVDAWIASGETVALHCRAGLGRTGTLLTAQLIWAGETALDALERARTINPRWVQSDEQVSFLSRFETWLSERKGGGGQAALEKTSTN